MKNTKNMRDRLSYLLLQNRNDHRTEKRIKFDYIFVKSNPP